MLESGLLHRNPYLNPALPPCPSDATPESPPAELMGPFLQCGVSHMMPEMWPLHLFRCWEGGMSLEVKAFSVVQVSGQAMRTQRRWQQVLILGEE